MTCGVSKVLAAKLKAVQVAKSSSDAASTALREAKTKHETVQTAFQSYTKEEEMYTNNIAKVIRLTCHFEHHLVEINMLLCMLM